ncbi:MAG TPA: tetratricopeptide repeat protein [Trichormus sp.]|jgi:hypothetical protein
MRVRILGPALPVVLGLVLSIECSVAGVAKTRAGKVSSTGKTSGTQKDSGKRMADAAPVGAVPASNESPAAAVERGKRLLQSKQYAQAVGAFTDALRKNDSLKQAYLLRGDCEQQLKKYADAASDYGQYSLLSPNDIGGYLRLSKVYGCLGKSNIALSYLSKAVVLDPRDASIYSARAALYDKLGQHAMAVDDRTVAAALAKARTHPDKGVVMTVAPGPKKVHNGSAPNQNQTAASGQQANGAGQQANGSGASVLPSQVAGSASQAKSHTP